MKVLSFDEIAALFIEQVHTVVWCNAATVDEQERPRSRVLHPIWEVENGRPVGWIITGRQTLKSRHLEKRPFLSLAYVANPLAPIYVDCHVSWADDQATKDRIWELFKAAPPPLGYDPAPFFGSKDSPGCGILHLSPWRVELTDLFHPQKLKVWHDHSVERTRQG